MKDGYKTKKQLLNELEELHKQIKALKASEGKHKRTEEALKESEERYRKITETITDYIFSVRIKDGRPSETVHSPACSAVTGYTSKKFASDPYLWFRMVHKKDRENVQRQASQIYSEKMGYPLEHRIVRKDGAIRWVRNTPALHFDDQGELVSYDGLIQDITERKQAEEALQKAYAKLEKRVEERTAELVIANKKLNEEIKEHNKTEEELKKLTYDLGERVKELNCLYGISRIVEDHGISSEEMFHDIVNLIPPAMQYPEITCARIYLGEEVYTTKNYKEAIYTLKSNIIVHGNKIGNLEICYSEKKPERDEGPFLKEERNLINAIAERLGRTLERKQAEKELKIRDIALKSSISPVAFADLKGDLTYVNPSFLRFWGFATEKEVLGKQAVSFWNKEEKAFEIMALLRETGSWTGELVAKRKDGSLVSTHISANMVLDKDNKPICIMASFMDTTQIKLLQNQLVQSERLAATGQLAASIAHEINSPLQSITIALSEIKRKHTEDRELSESIDLIKGAFKSIQSTVKNLLDLNRPGKEKKRPTNINEIIKTTVDLIQGHLKKNRIKVNLDLSSKVPDIIASPQQLGQIFLNLINNAIEAISDKSEPKDIAETQTSTSKVISIKTNLRKKNILIIVSDTGGGISEDDLNHIFDPFYTKKKKMGMGIGLSTCHLIIEDYKGTIEVRNSPEGGAVFTINLPTNGKDQ